MITDRTMTLNWHNGAEEMQASIRGDMTSLLHMARHTVCVHGMEMIPVRLEIRGRTWEGTAYEDSEMRVWLMERCR